jgi:hypothetical protein
MPSNVRCVAKFGDWLSDAKIVPILVCGAQ